jgi:hypothetical protein
MDKIVVTRSNDTNMTGIQGYLYLPTDFYVANNNSDYFNFYFGFGGSYMESGISYSKKWGSGQEWHKFMNPGCSTGAKSEPFSTQPTPGERIHLKLVNNGNGTATLYINGYQQWTVKSCSTMPSTNYVKMAQGAGDYSGQVSYNITSFSGVQYRDTNNDWHDWTYGFSYDDSKQSEDLTVYTWLPLSTSLA